MKKYIYWIITVLILLALSLGFFVYQKSRYKAMFVKKGTLQITVAATGAIHAEKEANLRFGSTGRIAYLPYKVNDEVKKGAVVATLDLSDLKAIQEKELKNYLDARRALDRQQNKTDEGTQTDDEKFTVEQKQTAVERAVIDVEIADRAAKNASLYAPFDGVVTAVNGQINEWSNSYSTAPLVSIADFTSLYFGAQVDQESSNSIQVGQAASITYDAHPGVIHKGHVYEISRQVVKTEDGDSVVPVKIKFDDAIENIKLHWEGDAQIVVDKKNNVLLVPKTAVVTKDGKSFVYTEKSLFVELKPITLGTFDGTNWEVLNGLQPNEKILIPKSL